MASISAFRKAIRHYLSVHWVPLVKRPQEKIKLIKFMKFQKSSIKHWARRDYHMQDEQDLSKKLT